MSAAAVEHDELLELRAENESLCRAIAAVNLSMWHQTQDRFHAFDAIRDDRCPACGGPVTVERRDRAEDGVPEGIRLVAVRT